MGLGCYQAIERVSQTECARWVADQEGLCACSSLFRGFIFHTENANTVKCPAHYEGCEGRIPWPNDQQVIAVLNVPMAADSGSTYYVQRLRVFKPFGSTDPLPVLRFQLYTM